MTPPTSASDRLLGRSEAMSELRQELARAAESDATVLIHGESGTGKGLAARALHELGARSEAPFVLANLAEASESLVEATLFGHEKGAFTDAGRERKGLFRRAHGGTIVLDDVDLLPGQTQVKLLRVLQERVVEPLGSESPEPVDVRVVATSRRDLRTAVEEGGFREDLYWRLAVVSLELPPLRVRDGDLPLLAEEFSERAARRIGVAARPFSAAALAALERHSWPGNVRELENAVERCLVLGRSGEGGVRPVEPEELGFLAEGVAGAVDDIAARALSHGFSVDEVALRMMEMALGEQRGNVSAAARQVGMTRRAFDYRMGRAKDDS